MEKTGKAMIYLFFFYIVAIVFNTFDIVDYNAPIIVDIAMATGVCFLISVFLGIMRVNWDSAFSIGIIFAYIATLVIMFIDTESPMMLVNFVVAIVFSIIVTKN
ncbi:MAG: hypothetical protein B6I20_03700 [Bacteroidetes bacterium 4572_117]|nr:MAG: hypothetical protein B6I20_03700 [Bacteroidetes bacterium 4572_117]